MDLSGSSIARIVRVMVADGEVEDWVDGGDD